MSETADLVFVNGHVVTVDADNSIAQALAVHGNVIMAVGDNAAINALVGPSTRIVDLAGATLLPGINDSHIHAVSLGYSSPPISLNVSFPTVKSIADVVEAVREAASTRGPGEWILGGGWDPGYLSECVSEPGRYPHRHDLDAAAPNNPVFLNDFSLHSGWVNTATLQLAGIDLQGDFTDDDNVVSDADGRPTGVVYERVAFAMRGLIPAVSQEAIRRSVGQIGRAHV